MFNLSLSKRSLSKQGSSEHDAASAVASRHTLEKQPDKPAGLLKLWQRIQRLPFNMGLKQTIFKRIISRKVPYTGSVHPVVIHLESGFAKVKMRDRRAVRNHLNSIHAIALANLGEFSSGIAMLTALPPSVSSIVTDLQITFNKKARGTLIAEGRASPPQIVRDEEVESMAYAMIYDEEGDAVAEVAVTWRLRPKKTHQKATSNTSSGNSLDKGQ